MAVFETMKAVLSARTVLRLGPVVPRKLISPMSCIPVQDTKDDLSLNLRHLTLSPAEAQLSSQFLASAVSASSQNTAELRLPPLRKPAIITVPTLYNGVVLEKDLPPLLNILEKIDPFEPQQSMETPPSQAEQNTEI
ncbi:hypothetical protein GWK47_051180 [Chionoecetes opilio]|uniref:Uncharacterized protein n=1 Tax=Chionoecetes opilio TaxID=41210 RepID=A0A8J5CSI4_CHIOP|nr:hypothetical protein GWK47_051180 [Chionoecetes opilio]